jgi:5-methylcytosine-specific restriction endonuclease McrA
MVVHGVDLRQLDRRDFESLAAASMLLYNLAKPLYAEDKEAWRILVRVRRYVTTLHTFAVKPPRTFNRDLLYPVKKDKDGNRLCRWCQKPCGNRRSYCGKPCLKEVDIRCSAGMLRHYVKERDKGICDRTWFSGEFSKDSFLARLGFNRHGSLWEADHIVEVSNGGESILENTQTLCVPCHKAKTKRMHRERARQRRVTKQPELAVWRV